VPTREQVAAQFFESGAAVPTRAQVEASFFAHFDALVQGAADGIGDLVKFVQAYRAAVHSVDEQIGRVLRALSSAGLDGGTVVAVTSDHGMQLGRKGQLYKNMPWEHTARVPLLVRVPTLPAGHGVGCDHVVSLIDLLPTFADLAGVNVQKQSQSFDGTSLLPLLREPRCASCAAGSGVAITKGIRWGQAPIALGLQRRDGRPPWWSVRDARWRLIIYVNSPQVELYDHDADPEEVVNLAGGAEGSEAPSRGGAARGAVRRGARLRPPSDVWRCKPVHRTSSGAAAAVTIGLLRVLIDEKPLLVRAKRANRVIHLCATLPSSVSRTPLLVSDSPRQRPQPSKNVATRTANHQAACTTCTPTASTTTAPGTTPVCAVPATTTGAAEPCTAAEEPVATTVLSTGTGTLRVTMILTSPTAALSSDVPWVCDVTFSPLIEMILSPNCRPAL
jgi:hypothetical protein